MKRHSQNVSAMLISPSCAQEEISSWKSKILDPPALEQSKEEQETALKENLMHGMCKGDMAEAGMFYTLWQWPPENFSLDGLWIEYLFRHVLNHLISKVSALQNIAMNRAVCSCRASLTQWDSHQCAGCRQPKKNPKELASCAHKTLHATALKLSVGGVKLGVWSVIWNACALKKRLAGRYCLGI